MPCTQTGSIDGDRALSAETTLKEVFKRNTKLTRYLCEAMGILDCQGLEFEVSGDARAWWRKHKKIDAKRLARKKRHAKRKKRDKKRKRVLVCETCGDKHTKKNPVTIGPDPFAMNIDHDDTPYVMCRQCRRESAAEI